MSDFFSKTIVRDPRILQLKKKVTRRSLLENFEPMIHPDSLKGSHPEDGVYQIVSKPEIEQLVGKYERYYLEPKKNCIMKDILIVHQDGGATIRSLKNLYRGVADYTLNSVFSITIKQLNDKETASAKLMAYVGSYDISSMGCLFALCLTSDFDHQPIARQEVLIPSTTSDSLLLPGSYELNSIDFFKLQHRYPDLLKHLQQRPMVAPKRVNWE
jgi:hypothetical protein